MTQDTLIKAMQAMRALVEPEGPAPEVETVDWRIPHRFSQESAISLKSLAAKLAGHLEKCLDNLSGQPFEMTVEGIHERYAEQLYLHVSQQQPPMYYLPLTQAGKGHIGFIRLPFETAAILVGCMLRDPDAEIGKDGQMSSLAESILTDAAAGLADAVAKGFDEYGVGTIDKAERLVYLDWPVRFRDLEDLCEFEFKAVCEQVTLNVTLTVMDEVIAEIAQLKGPFGRAEEKNEQSDRIVKRMHDAPMAVAALLSSGLMALNTMLTLETGDVVILDRKITEPIDVLVNGQPCLRAWPAAHDGRCAMLIADEQWRQH
ncbi:MAG: FliM/FliN family flagellar motor switch protein [Phycisphaerae bacterium]|nr:FliM/FliN family flagellar motor switch protein [Phycisphaerae bacterium]